MVVMGVGGVAVQTRRRVTCEARLPSRMERPRGRQRPPPLRPRRRFRPAGLPGTCGRPCWRLRRRCPLSTERALNGGWRSLKPSDEWCARSSCGPWGGGGAPVAAAAPSSTSAGEPQAGAAKAATASPSQGDAGRPAGAAADGTTTPAGAPEAAAAAGAVPTPNGPFAGAPPTASVHSVVTAHFREWLSSSNNMRQLQELVALTPEQQLQ